MLVQFVNSKNIYRFTVIFLVILTISNIIECKQPKKIPADIKLCAKNDPELDNCLVNLFESLRPRLMQGIPEIGLPPLDPLVLEEVIVLPGGAGQMKAIGRDVKITGISNFKLNHLKTNVENLEVDVSVSFPYLRYEGTYDVNAKLINLAIKGKGPMRGNATDITATALLKAKFVDIENEKFVEFTSAKVNITVKDYSIKVEKLFPDKQLNDAINALLNDRKLQSMATARPIVNKVAGDMLLEMVNRISRNLSFEDVFA